MKSKQIVAAIFALIFFSSCSINNLEPNHKVVGSSDIITVLGRVSNFTEQDVVTRSPKDSEERKVTSIAMAIFPVKNDGTGVNGDCVYYEYFPNSNEVMFAINRGDNTFNNGRYVIYAFANMPGMNVDGFGEGTSLEDMLRIAYNLSDKPVNIPKDGFPMIGSLGDTFSEKNTEKDNKILYIKPDGDSDPRIHEPIKDEAGEIVGWEEQGTAENTLTIPMKAMYAKINFSIKIDPTEKDETGTNFPPQFTFEGYTINNIPSSVDFDMGTNSDTDVITSVDGTNVEGQSVLIDSDDELTFSFYLPERLLTPATPAEGEGGYDYKFPEVTNPDTDKDGNGIRDEDEPLRQRYKGLLLDSGQKATNVVISGKYRDHQNLSYDVDYTIHLGEDNYGDFNIIRNKEYNNYVTIKGIENSNDDKQTSVSFDHRVNIERSQPAIISLRREMLLDSHFEIRPLRVRKSDVGNVGDINAVKVEVVNPTTTNWMRIERSFGGGKIEESPKNSIGESIYITEGVSAGKRRYFTYDLISGTTGTNNSLAGSTEVIVPITNSGECVWIYVDECTEVGDGVRSGVVQVTYGNLTGNTFTATMDTETYPVVKYSINQRKLFKVTYDTNKDDNEFKGNDYCIEYEEEYLHNFDSEEGYGSTDYEGMKWGLDNALLSFDHKAVVFDSGEDWVSEIVDYIINGTISTLTPFYDFYIDKYDSNIMPTASYRHNRKGYDFCEEILTDINTKDNKDRNTGYSDYIDRLPLNEHPSSAIEYCYNKNKRNEAGEVVKVNDDGTVTDGSFNWYLPAIDEIEDIVTGQYIDSEGKVKNCYVRFEDFQNKFYWSCQPAYISNMAHYYGRFLYIFQLDDEGMLYTDDITSARATKVSYSNQDYSAIESGTTGYQNYIYFNEGNAPQYFNLAEQLEGKQEWTYTYYEGWFSNRTKTFKKSDLMKTDDGHIPRNKMARVRCVRYMGE